MVRRDPSGGRLIRDATVEALIDLVGEAARRADGFLSRADLEWVVSRLAFLVEDELLATRAEFARATARPGPN